jgi:hypothetical protein
VAVAAAISKLTSVGIVDRMTAYAVLGRFFVSPADVAADAACLAVCTHKRIQRLVVVESGRSPIGLAVAISAIRRKRAVVGVIRAMTADAFDWCLASALTGGMALPARSTLMSAEKRVVGLRVIEGGSTESADICSATLMVGMARTAFPARRQQISAVKAAFGFDGCTEIAGNVLVAIETEPALRRGVEGLVAGRTIALVFRM